MTVNNDDYLKVTMEFNMPDGSIAQNIFHFKASLTGPYSDALIIGFIETYMEDAYGELSTSLPDTMSQRLCTVQEIAWASSTASWEVTKTLGYFTPTIAFSDTSEPLPNQSSAFVTFNTSRPKSKGRKFAPAFGEDRQSGTFLIAAALSDMTDFANEILAGVFVAALNSLIVGVPRTGVETWLPFTGGVLTNVLGSQRRRRPTVGI